MRLPIKFLKLAIEALEYRIASMKTLINDPKTTDDTLATIDYGNDIPILNTVIEEFQKAINELISKNESVIVPEKLSQYKEIQEAWANNKQIIFAKEIAYKITICIKEIGEKNELNSTEKNVAILHLNELQYFVLGYINALESDFSNNEQYHFFEEVLRQLANNEVTKNFVNYLLKETFLKVFDIPDKNYKDFSQEYLIYHQALNEVCHGANALPDWEFGTLMGVTKPEAVMLLNRQIDFFDKK